MGGTMRHRHSPQRRGGSASPQPCSSSDDISDNLSSLPPYKLQCVLLALACLPFLTSLDGEFVFDDVETIVNNADVSGRHNAWTDLFWHDFWGSNIRSNASHKSYRPLTTLTFRLQHAVSGPSTRAYHVVNIMLHGAVVLLVHATVRQVAIALHNTHQLLPALTAALFALHPVANITGRAELLSAVCFLCSLLCHMRWMSGSVVAGGLSLLAAALGLLCKEQAITVLAVNIVVDVVVSGFKVSQSRPQSSSTDVNNNQCTPSKPIGWQQQGTAVRATTAGLFGVALLLGRLWVIGFAPPNFTVADNPAAFMTSTWLRSLNYNYVYSLNVWLLLAPVQLCFDYSMGCIPLIQSAADCRLAAPLAMWTGIVALAGWLYCTHRLTLGQKLYLVVAGAIGALTFVPSSNLVVRVGFVLAERVLYLPSLGYCMLLAAGLLQLQQHRWLVVVLLGAYAAKCAQRSCEWRTSFELFASGAAVCPNNAKVHYNLAQVLSEDGAEASALTKYQLAIRLNPHYEQAMNNLANLLEKRAQYAEAEHWLREALRIRPSFTAAWMNLGIVLAAQNRSAEAERSYGRALGLRPRHADCWYNLGNLYLATHRYGAALLAWSNATVHSPGHGKAWVNQMVLLDEQGDCATAVHVAEQALQHVHTQAHQVTLHAGLGSCLAKLQRWAQAETHLLTAVRLQPTASNHANLGVLYHRWRKYPEAEHWYTSALALDPHMQLVHTNLAMLPHRRPHRTNHS